MMPTLKYLTGAFAFAAILLLGTCPAHASPQGSPKPPSLEGMRRGFSRELQSITLQREAVMAALASLDREVAAIVADRIFSDYAGAAGKAREEVEAALFPTKDGNPVRSELAPPEMANAAKRFEEQWNLATDAAIDALARAGSANEASAKELKADLYRRLLATAEPLSREPLRLDVASTSDTLTLWREACDRDPLLTPARTWITTHPQFVAALERFRREGEGLGRERFRGIAERTMFYAEPESDRIPVELRFDRRRLKASLRSWRVENHLMAEAIEASLLAGPAEGPAPEEASGVGSLPAARWTTHYLRVARSDAVPTGSTTASMISLATSLGVSEVEASAMKRAIDEATVQRANVFRRIVRAYDEWESDAIKREARLFDSPPPENLVKSYDELDALDAATKNKIAAAIESPFVRKRAKLAGEQQLPPHVIPMWRALQTGQAMMQGVTWGPSADAAQTTPAR
jgi:hypothetical protein